MTETTWPAPAKINLFLHVLGREPDGYHRLQTLFQLLDWGDSVRIEVTSDRQVSMLKPTPGVPAVEDLCVRAAEILQAKTGARAGARIAVTKRIPLGAGLGGGSSDAATVLFALNALWRTGLTVSELAEIGLRIGADVPVFIHGHTAWAEGRGERLRPMPLGEQWYVLAFPGIEVSTAEVFSAPELKRDTPPIEPGDYRWAQCTNDCQPTVLQRQPQLREWVAGLSEWGKPRMSGTGSCFYIPAGTAHAAGKITQALKSRYNVRAVRGVDRSALLEKCAETH